MILTQAPDADLNARFEQAAEEARAAEQAYRQEAALRIAALAQERSTAFRRLNLLRGAIKALVEAQEPESAVAHARFVIGQSLGWEEIGPRQDLVLDQLTPFFEALQAGLADPDAPAAMRAQEALRAFEDWYQAEIGSDFYALFDRYMPETPRVDF